MKFGVCQKIGECLEAYPYEADFVEINAAELSEIDEGSYNSFRRAVQSGEMNPYSANVLFPGNIRLTGEDVDWNVVKDYCDKTFHRLGELGVKVVVFGSGKAKHIPDGFSRDAAWDQLVMLGNLLSDFATPYGQTVVVEPLNSDEVNIINSVDEGAKYCHLVGRDNFALLVDFYHFTKEKESIESLRENMPLLKHAHIATPKHRTRPRYPWDWKFFSTCIHQLEALGYTGNLSFEGGKHSADALNKMVRHIKKL